ncbi:MAG TPA: CpsD/CapB family tyrosine-protein kinase [Verrucomicrobiae bacterium]|jgi:capsular exopolysaccharide synthesis family protein|nr:CpsD/CapB family tyrosine-protein kinase [Verrucomicrobiae bacterium]
MSKFSDALNKIQHDSDSPAPKAPKASKPASFRVAAEGTEEKKVAWDAGIKHEKNCKPDIRIVTYNFPNSLVTEQYRMMRTSLKSQLQKSGAQVILVSSSLQGEGKSITSTNLALSLAEDQDVRVALIDADLRKGKIHEYMGFGGTRKGLSDLLTEELNPKEVFVKNSIPNLCIMPRGHLHKNPSTLVNSQKFRLLIAELRLYFDYIIIDSPPIMSVADPGIMARDVDGVLFIIQIGRTPKSMIAQSNLLFKQAGARMLGYVLTNVQYQSADYRYYNNYYLGYGHELDNTSFKKKARHHMKVAGINFENTENKFNAWWQKHVLKSGKKAILPVGTGEDLTETAEIKG